MEYYLQVTLTDEQDIPDAIAKLRSIYPNILELRYDNARTRAFGEITAEAEPERRTPMELSLIHISTPSSGQRMSPTTSSSTSSRSAGRSDLPCRPHRKAV